MATHAHVRSLPRMSKGEGPWRKLKDERVVTEINIATVKMYQGGALEMCPGLSEEEPESDDDGPFQSARGARVVAEHGPRLTTFSVPAPGQRAFQYTIENVNAELDPTRIEEV